ncbi:MAG: Asp-tRNA(Asn)/Glu-tRNA(Gln) amidotransferase GatCAB subunit C [Chloroflexi bacterium]|nr:Asp-tRNA(Asn)/Glu-tRNA(Gln) amidotransferase GatCAB subunit C [Chloroflexota bacterium]
MSINELENNKNELTIQDVENIALLCRIAMSDAELESMLIDLKSLLSEVDVISAVQTDNIHPTSHVIETVKTVLRDDYVADSLTNLEVLSNAPSQQDGFFKIRRVLE